MKLSLLVLSAFVFGSPLALANNKCLTEAKLQARIFSAKENKVALSSIKAIEWFFAEETDGVLYYGVRLDNQENINVGLRKNDCTLAQEPNYVTDSLGGFMPTAQKNRLKLSGADVLEDQSINQYDDVDDPYQGYVIEVPKGYYVQYTATPDDGEGRLCTLTMDEKARNIVIDAPNLDTDNGGCFAFVIYGNVNIGAQKTVSYYIEQTGT